MNRWSLPSHGVQHLQGLRPRYQVTVVDHESFAECLLWTPDCGNCPETTRHDTTATAREFGEKWARQVGAIGGAA